jgi:hypothetical protein
MEACVGAHHLSANSRLDTMPSFEAIADAVQRKTIHTTMR